MQIPVCEIFWQRFFISWINGAIFYLHDVNFWLPFFGPSFRYNLVTIGVLEFVVVIDVYAQPTREKIKFYRTASKRYETAFPRVSAEFHYVALQHGRCVPLRQAHTASPATAGTISVGAMTEIG